MYEPGSVDLFLDKHVSQVIKLRLWITPNKNGKMSII
jgi:hypothetical protein